MLQISARLLSHDLRTSQRPCHEAIFNPMDCLRIRWQVGAGFSGASHVVEQQSTSQHFGFPYPICIDET